MQYIHVKLLNGFAQSLTYSVPDTINQDLRGMVVQVPLKDRITSAYVIDQVDHLNFRPAFAIKPMHAIEQFPADNHYQPFLRQLSAYYQMDPLHFVKRIKQFVNQEASEQLMVITPEHSPIENIQLTPEQQHIVDAIAPSLKISGYNPCLIHGVTGSGKTEIYKRLIQEAISLGNTALLLLPEVSLALRFEQLLKEQMPSSITIIGFHSGTRPKDKKLLWQRLLEGKPTLIIGVHIPILLPIAKLGLIIVDEEHETGYQEKKHPKVNSKEAALIRAQLAQIPIVLGSATPSISSLHCARTKQWQLFSLHKRFAGSFPKIQIVLLTNKERRSNFWITRELEKAIVDRLQKKEQIIIFLNRRGHSFFVQCKDCSFIFECAQCSVSLTLHNNNELTCHYCGNGQQLPPICPSCKKKDLIKKGLGTQQVVTILESLFAHARIGRADMDISNKKKLWQETLQSFENGTIDILVGTQTITKGFHFPRVTLVGILWADLNLHFPVYNASETSLQQLIQVAGRAGRVSHNSSVIVQTMMDHPIFNYTNEVDYIKFYEYELANRQTVGYPPILRLAEIELKNTNEVILEKEATQIAHDMSALIENSGTDITLLGPSKPPVSKIKNTHSRKLYIKSTSINHLIMLYKKIDKSRFKSSIFFTPNP